LGIDPRFPHSRQFQSIIDKDFRVQMPKKMFARSVPLIVAQNSVLLASRFSRCKDGFIGDTRNISARDVDILFTKRA
jgi:hypothetical protein